ncbi:MAG: hypothetical protein MR266_03000 [Erysipelotrichaceae bacterium]|nr:hypothetical protein [Erysipelotrichaceae bacterium]
MLKYFYIPAEVWYYVVIPILIILLIYFVFNLVYHRKKGTYYYNYVVDYVYSTLGVLFCSLLLCLLLGYSIATIQILSEANVIQNNILMFIVLLILPIIPTIFLGYVLKVYIKNLKRKRILDDALEEKERELIKK